MIKLPLYTPAVIVGVFAAIIMVGNALQNRKLGTARVEALGQVVLLEYKLAPQRLAITAVGLVVAYFWTIFPYPLSEHTELRQDLSQTLYLLANFNLLVTQTIIFRVKYPMATKKHQEEEDRSSKTKIAISRQAASLLWPTTHASDVDKISSRSWRAIS